MNNQKLEFLLNNKKELEILLKTDFSYFLKFNYYFINKQNFVIKNFHKQIIEYFNNFVFNIEKTKNLIINISPRVGKTELIKQFITYLFIVLNKVNIMYISYDLDLSLKKSKEIRDNIYLYEYYKMFNLEISKDTKAKDEWEINKKEIINNTINNNISSMFSKSINSGITGRGADFIFIDDPNKITNKKSSLKLDDINDLFETTLKSRLDDKEKGRFIIIQQRYDINDLSGYLLNKYNEDFDLIKIPAIINNQSIFEEKIPLNYLLKEKEKNYYTFKSQYQQEPFIEGGEIIKQEYFNEYDDLPKLKQVYIVGDTAFKTKTTSDYSVFQLWGKDNYGSDSNYFLIDMIRGKWESPELLNNLLSFYNKYKTKYFITSLNIEDKASGIGLIQEIKRLSIPIKEVQVNKDKYTRLMDVLPKIKNKYVFLPKYSNWKQDFLNECMEFSANNTSKHDDQVDCLTMALSCNNYTLKDFI